MSNENLSTERQTVFHPAKERGFADHGWLKAAHSFSFASYYDPQKMGFGLLRVLNDDCIAPSKGFGTHPHQDMEIVTIPLSGALQHKDSEGNEAVIRAGEVQAMSAGTGVFHSEYNASNSEDVRLLQIWVLPEKMRIQPRYDQKKFPDAERQNRFQLLVAPLGTGQGTVEINQNAYFSMASLSADQRLEYQQHRSENGVYFFLLDGQTEVNGQRLEKRDALGGFGGTNWTLAASRESEILVIETPMG